MQIPAVKNRLEEKEATDHSPRGGQPLLSTAVPFVIAVLAATVCYSLFYRRGVWLSVIGYSVSPAERVLYGEVPYRDFLYNYTPGMLWLNALLMNLFAPSLLTISSGLLAFKLLTIAVLFFAGRRLTSAKIALIPVGLTLAWIGYKYIFGVFPTQYSMLFVLLGLISLLRYDVTGRRSWLLLTGSLIGVVFVFKYNVGILLLATVTLSIAIRETALAPIETLWTRRLVLALGKCAFYWAGFTLIAGALFLYLAANDAFGAMIDHFYHHIFEYGEKRSVALPSLKQLGPAVLSLILLSITGLVLLLKRPRFYEPFLLMVVILGSAVLLVPGRAYYLKVSTIAFISYMPIILFGLVALWLFWTFRSEVKTGGDLKRWWSRTGVFAIVMLVAMGAFLEIYPRADLYHIVRVLPPVFLLLVLIVHRVWPGIESFITGLGSLRRRAAILTAAAPLLLLVSAGVMIAWQPQFDSKLRFIERVPLALERAEGILVNRKQAEMIGSLESAIAENSLPGEPIFSFAQKGAAFYFLSERRNPTRFVWWRSVGIKEEDRASVIRLINDRTLKLIILQDGLKDPRVREAVTVNYDLVKKVTDLGVYRRKEATTNG